MQLSVFTEAMQPQAVRFFKRCFAALNWVYSPDGRHGDTADIKSHYMNGGCFWCLYDNDELIGTVALRTIDLENTIFELKRLFVLPEYQGRGYGSLLLKRAVDYAKRKKYKAIRLDTRSDLIAAQQLYAKHGFKQIGRYNSNSRADLYFELDLEDCPETIRGGQKNRRLAGEADGITDEAGNNSRIGAAFEKRRQ